jgi:uncharacterized protein YaaW (UPF0174 family)
VKIKNNEDEANLEIEIFEQIWIKLPEDKKQNIYKEAVKKAGIDYSEVPFGSLIAITATVGGRALFPYIIALLTSEILVSILGQAGVQIAGRIAAPLLGPVGIGLSIAWLLNSIAGPAYTKTIPAVAYIAYIRSKVDLRGVP